MTEPIGLTGIFELDNFDAGMSKYLSAINKANDETNKTAGSFGKSFGNMGDKVNSVAGTLAGVLVGSTVVAGAALGGFAIKGIGQAEEMEKQMSAIASIMGKTTEAVKPLSDEIIKLGLDPTLMVDATQAADAIQQLAKNGLSMDQILQGAAKSTVLLANATGADFGQAADIATGAMKLFNINAGDMQDAVSGMVSVTTNSKLTIQDYAQALANGGGAATAAGVNFKDFNTTLAATAPLFAGGGDAATSLKTFLNRLQPTTKGATEAMIQLGLATKDGKSKFFDASGSIKDMSEISGILAKGLSGLSDAQKSQALSTIFGADAMRTAIGLANVGEKGFADLQAQMGKTDAADAAAVRMDNLAGVIEIAKGAVDAISLSIGQAFLPMLTRAAKSMSQFVSDHGQQLIDFFQTVADVIDALVSGTPTDFPWEDVFPPWLSPTAYAVAQTIEGLGKVVSDFHDGAISEDYPWDKIFPAPVAMVADKLAIAIAFVNEHLTAFSGALAGVGVVLASAGIYAALTALTAAIAAISLPILALIGVGALLGAAWATDWGGIQELVLPIISAIGTGITDVGIVIKSFTEDVPGAYPWEDIFPPWLAATMHFISYNVQGIQTVMDDFHNGVFTEDYPWEEIFPPSTAELALNVQIAVMKVQNAIEALQTAFAPLTSAIQTNGAGALTEIQAFATGNETSFTNLTAIWNGLTATVQNVFDGIGPVVTASLSAFETAIAPWADASIAWISSAAETLPDKISAWYTALTNAVTSYVGQWVVFLMAWSDPLVSWVATAITNLPGKISEWYNSLTTAVSSFLTGWVNYLLNWSAPLVDWINTAIASAPGKVTEWYNALTETVTNNLAGWVSYLTAWSAPLVDWIGNAISDAPGKITEWYNALTSSITSYLGGWVVYLMAWSDPLVNWIDTAITNISSKVSSWFTTLTSTVSANLPMWVAAFPAWEDAAVAWLGTAATNVVAKVGEFAGNLLPELANHLPDWIAAFFDWSATAVDWISTAIAALPVALGLFVNKIITWGTGDGLNGIISAVVGWSGAFIDWVDEKLIPKVAPAMGRFLAELLVGMGKIALGIVAGVALIDTAIYNTLMNTDWLKAGQQIIELLIKGIKATIDAVTTVAKATTDAIYNKFSDVDWHALGVLIMTKVQAGISSLLENMKSTVNNITDATKAKFLEPNWSRIGQDIIVFIQGGVTATLQALLTAFKAVTDAVVAAWKAIDWKALGTAIITDIGDAAVAAATALYTKIQTIIDDIKKKFTDFDWKTLGTAIIDGMMAGIEKGKQALWDKVNGLVDAIKKKIKDALGIGSPAKVMIPYGQAIVQGLMAGISMMQGALLRQVSSLSNSITKNFQMPGGNIYTWFGPQGTTDSLSTVEDYASAFGDLVDLSNEWLKNNPDMQLISVNDLDMLGKSNDDLKSRIKLMDVIKQYHLDPVSVFGGKDILSADPAQVFEGLIQASRALNYLTKDRLLNEQNEMEKMYLVSKIATKYGDQAARINELGQHPMNFFQQQMFINAQKSFQDLTDQINAVPVIEGSVSTKAAGDLIMQLGKQREDVLAEVDQFQKSIFADQVKNDNLSNIYTHQIQLLDQAKSLGMNTADLYKNFFTNEDSMANDALKRMSMLEDVLATASVAALKKQVAEKALISTLDTNWNISGIASSFVKAYTNQIMSPLLDRLKSVLFLEDERNKALNDYSNAMSKVEGLNNKSNQLSFLNDQISLLKQVSDAGLDIKSVFAGILSGKEVLGEGANINTLLGISNQLMQSLIDKANKQLTPAAVALAAQQQQVDAQKSQLDLLNRQLDIIHQGQQAGVNWEGFFNGLTTGINASEADILTATSRLYNKLIKQALDELGIHSPSTVMMDIGQQMVAGLKVGWQNGASMFQNLLSTVPTGNVTNRSLSFSMGGVNINNGMDEMMLENRIQRILERTLGG